MRLEHLLSGVRDSIIKVSKDSARLKDAYQGSVRLNRVMVWLTSPTLLGALSYKIEKQ